MFLLFIQIQKKIYLQERSRMVPYLPGCYCTSAGGHVGSGESFEQAAQRELQEELGIQTFIRKIHSFIYAQDEQKRFIELFIAFHDGPFYFKDGEVESGQFFSFEEAQNLIEKGEKIHPQLNACFRWLYEHRNVLEMNNK